MYLMNMTDLAISVSDNATPIEYKIQNLCKIE